MITCLATNWGVTIIISLLLTTSEWLSRTNKFEANGLLDVIIHFLRLILHKRDEK